MRGRVLGFLGTVLGAWLLVPACSLQTTGTGSAVGAVALEDAGDEPGKQPGVNKDATTSVDGAPSPDDSGTADAGDTGVDATTAVPFPANISSTAFDAATVNGPTGVTVVIDTSNPCTITPGIAAELLDCSNSAFVVVRVLDWQIAGLNVTGPRPLVIAAKGNVLLDGTISVAAVGAVAGPGAVALGTGAKGIDGGGGGKRSGGGGAGHGAPGAASGTADNGNVAGAAGGPSYGAFADLTGGSAGGNSTKLEAGCGSGGGGGGALQVSAQGSISFGTTAAIHASGGGGLGGCGDHGGGGGGSGGTVILEAKNGVTLTTDLSILATGGGGGGGGAGGGGGGNGGNGKDGDINGGDGGDGLGDGTKGGKGGGTDVAKSSDTAKKPSGGGGGAVGRIYVRNAMGTTGSKVVPPITPIAP
jgi:hypothetical protein